MPERHCICRHSGTLDLTALSATSGSRADEPLEACSGSLTTAPQRGWSRVPAVIRPDDRFDLGRRRTARHRNGDRALVPRPLRSVATPHGWIVANAIARCEAAGR